LRATIKAQRGASEAQVKQAALGEEAVQRHMNGMEIVKTVFVPDRLINLVVK
jgi:leucyl-tRNA synthetase